MKSTSINLFILFLLISSLKLNAQIQALFNNKTQARTLTERWELDSTALRGTFLLTPYKPIYILPARWSSHPNEQPYSGNNNPDYICPKTNYNNIEVRYQLSFKTKILQNFFWGHGDLWGAYTQTSNWQIYNDSLSSPFRETNYEPEVILNFPVRLNVLGFRARMVGVSFNHQSNGKSNPYSRSWNRVIFHAGFDRKNWSIFVRPWFRLRSKKDDNPDICNYIGRGDMSIIYTKNGSIYTLTGSHNLTISKNFKGYAAFSWSYPIKGNLKGFLQVTHGYGETLIDYNNRQTTVGIGVSLIEWL